jgi:hypothetical protein
MAYYVWKCRDVTAKASRASRNSHAKLDRISDMAARGLMAEKKVLSGHKRVGKRFIPPMKQIPKMQDTSFVNDMLPELIWLGLINDNVGFVQGARFFEKLVSASVDALDGDKQGNFALVSKFDSFNADQKDALLRSLSQQALLPPLRDYLAPLVALYEPFPLKFVGLPEKSPSKEKMIATLQDCVGRHIDKYQPPGIMLHGMMLLSRLVTRTIHFPADMPMPDFNAVFENPESADAKLAAGFMRANGLAEFSMARASNNWARYFWNRGFEVSECEIVDYDCE